jgi:hypothetical protein
MAILVQRVSGDHFASNGCAGELFFPHIAGVGHSTNLYVWSKEMDPAAGMLRLVFGLGTRAVDRISGDYARIVPLDQPTKGPPVTYGDERKFSQHKVDVLNLRENRMAEMAFDSFWNFDLKTGKEMFFSVDSAMLARLQELGRPTNPKPQILDFKKLLAETEFPKLAAKILSTIEKAYNYPVDIEFTANFNPSGNFKINLLQCRPLQTKGTGKVVSSESGTSIPKLSQDSSLKEKLFFASTGNFMGGNVRLPLDYVIYIKAKEYLALGEQEKYQIARIIGMLNNNLKGSNIMLIGPGRWGTTTPSLGIPVHFSELCNATALCEVSYRQGDLMPELSFGSHFFHDIVESGIFYAAIFDGEEGVTFKPEHILGCANVLEEILPAEKDRAQVIHVAKNSGLTLYSDITSLELLCV